MSLKFSVGKTNTFLSIISSYINQKRTFLNLEFRQQYNQTKHELKDLLSENEKSQAISIKKNIPKTSNSDNNPIGDKHKLRFLSE